MLPWDELADKPDTPELTWRRAKRIAPTAIRELMPLLEGEPEAAFFLRPTGTAVKERRTAKERKQSVRDTKAKRKRA
jgi:hypothetical protein